MGTFTAVAVAKPFGFISEPDVGTSRLWGPPKGAKHYQKLLMRRSPTKKAYERLSFPQSEW